MPLTEDMRKKKSSDLQTDASQTENAGTPRKPEAGVLTNKEKPLSAPVTTPHTTRYAAPVIRTSAAVSDKR